MLANILAIVVGLGSFAFYMAAFIYPEVHRRADFLWSGLGFFYALVLWFGAGQVRGVVLLGQTASVGLLVVLGWQTLVLRRLTTPLPQRTPVVLKPELVTAWAGRQLDKAQDTIPAIETIRAAQVERKRVETSGPSSGWRRAYEYEFVEDGIDLASAKEPAKELAKESAQGLAKGIADESLAVPPEEFSKESAESFPEAPDASSEAVLDPPPEESALEASIEAPLEAVIEPSPAAPELADPDCVIPTPDLSTEAESLAANAKLPPSSADPQQSRPAATRSAPQGPISKAMIIADWLKELVVLLTRPKPARPMIELPPRPPSIPSVKPESSDEADGIWPAEELEDDLN